MKRKTGDHLSAADLAELQAILATGKYRKIVLIAQFSISRRSLNRHIAVAQGKICSRPLAIQDDSSALFKSRPICLVEGCMNRIADDKKRGFCAQHAFRPPANVARMTGRRA